MAEEYWEEMLQEKHKNKEVLGTNIGCCFYCVQAGEKQTRVMEIKVLLHLASPEGQRNQSPFQQGKRPSAASPYSQTPGTEHWASTAGVSRITSLESYDWAEA